MGSGLGVVGHHRGNDAANSCGARRVVGAFSPITDAKPRAEGVEGVDRQRIRIAPTGPGRERERFMYVLNQLQQIPLLVDAVLNQGETLGRPQRDAVDDINNQGGLYDDPSGSTGRR